MKYLKKFNEHKITDLGEDIAKDILPRFQKMRDNGDEVTVDIFDNYMKERGASSDVYHSVMNYLVDMGFDFDIENDEDGEFDEPFLKTNESLSFSTSLLVTYMILYLGTTRIKNIQRELATDAKNIAMDFCKFVNATGLSTPIDVDIVDYRLQELVDKAFKKM